MKKTFRIVQFGANLGIIVLSLLLTFVVLRQFIISPQKADQNLSGNSKAPSPVAPRPAGETLIGRVLPLQNIDWSTSETTVVLYLSTTCHFCNESSPFYQRLVAANSENRFKLVAVLPQSIDEATEYLASHKIKADQIISSSLASNGVTGTPTLMLVTKNGVVFDFWRGKLDEKKEAEVLSKLSS